MVLLWPAINTQLWYLPCTSSWHQIESFGIPGWRDGGKLLPIAGRGVDKPRYFALTAKKTLVSELALVCFSILISPRWIFRLIVRVLLDPKSRYLPRRRVCQPFLFRSRPSSVQGKPHRIQELNLASPVNRIAIFNCTIRY